MEHPWTRHSPFGITLYLWILLQAHYVIVAGSTWYHGCFHLDDIDTDSHGILGPFNGTLSYCSERCKREKTSFFGIQDVSCVCLSPIDIKKSLSPSNCEKRCKDVPDSSLPCGGVGSWSVYNTSGPYLLSVNAGTESKWLEAGLPVKMEVTATLDTFVDFHKELTPATEWKNVLEFVCRAGMTVEARVNISMNGSQEYTVCSLTFPQAGEYGVEVTVRNLMSTQTFRKTIHIMSPKPRRLQVSPLNPSWTLPSCTPLLEDPDKVIRESLPSLTSIMKEYRSYWEGVSSGVIEVGDVHTPRHDDSSLGLPETNYGGHGRRYNPKASPVIAVFVNQTLNLELSVATGVNLTFEFLVWNGTGWERFEQRPSDDDCGTPADCKQIVQNLVIKQTGAFPGVVLVHNRLGMVQTNVTIVGVDPDIGDMTVTTAGIDTNVVLTRDEVLLFRLTSVTTLRQSTSIQVDFGDGVVKTATVRERKNTTRPKRTLPTLFASYGDNGCNLSLEFDHVYHKQGVFKPLIKLYNNFTSKTIYSDEIVALNAIIGVKIITDKYVAKDAAVPISLTFQSHSFNMTAIWSVYNDKGEMVFNKTVKSIGTSGLNSLGITATFSEVGKFKIQCEVSNLLMKQRGSTYVMVQEQLSGLSMTCNKGQYIQVEDHVQCDARVSSGTDLNFVWGFQKQSGTSSSDVDTYICNYTTTDPRCTFNRDVSTIRHCFDHPGSYNVTVTASNELSSLKIMLPYYIQIQLPVGCLDVDMGSSTTPNTNSNIVATSNKGTGLSFDLDINDSGRVKVDPSRTVVIGDITTFSAPLVFPKADVYTVSVFAYNEISSTVKSVDVHVRTPVPPFSIRVLRRPLPSLRTLVVETISGRLLHSPSLVYTFHFPDGHAHVTQVPVVALDIRERLMGSDLDMHPDNGRLSFPVRVRVYNDVGYKDNTTTVDLKDRDIRPEEKHREKRQRKSRTRSKKRRGRRRTKRPVFWHRTFIRLGENTHFILENKTGNATSLLVDYGDGSREEVNCQGQSCNWDRSFQKPGVFRIGVSFLGKSGRSYTSSSAAGGTSSSTPRWRRPGLVQSVLVVEQPIGGLQVEGPRHAEIHCNHEWKATLKSGTNVVFVWTLDGIDNPATTIEKFYTAARHREHTLKVRAFNDISQAEKSITIWAKYPLKAVNFTIPPAELGTPLNITIQVYAHGSNFNISCDFGDGNSKFQVLNDQVLGTPDISLIEFPDIFDESTVYEIALQHTYTQSGNYTVTVTVDNGVSTVKRSKKLFVEERIGNITLRANHLSIMSINEKLVVTAEVSSGKNLQFRWDFQDKMQPSVTSEGRTSTAVHEFGIPDVYEVKVNVTSPNQPEGVVKALSYSINVLEPVTEASIVHRPVAEGFKGVASLDQRVSQNKMVTSAVHFVARSDGSSVSFTFDFGDGSKVTVDGVMAMPWNTGPSGGVSHVYKDVGTYKVSVTASNDLSNVTAVLVDPFIVQAPVSGLKLRASTCVQFGEMAVFSVSILSGTNVSFDWRMDDETERIDASNTVEHQYRSLGREIVKVSASNLVSREPGYIRISVVEDITGVKLTSENSVVIAGKPTNYSATIYPPSASVGVWYDWFLSPNKPPKQLSESRLVHKHTISGRQRVKVTAQNCLGTSESDSIQVHVVALLKGLSIVFKGDNLVRRPVPMMARYWSGDSLVFTWDFGDGSPPVVVNNTVISGGGSVNNTVMPVYKSVGEYLVTLKAENFVSSEEVTKRIFILETPCEEPEVMIQGAWKPGHSIVQELKFYKLDHIEVEAIVNVNCSLTSQVRFQWEIFEADSDKKVILGISQTWARETEMKHPNLLLPPGSMEPGLYTFRIRVDMNGTEIPVYTYSEAQVRVSRSPLYVTVKGGLYRTIGRNEMIVMDGSWSRDLDQPETELGYFWKCSPLGIADTGGEDCFDRVEGLPPRNQSIWEFPAHLLRMNVTEFVFNVSVWRLSDAGGGDEDEAKSIEDLQVSADQVIYVDSQPKDVLPLSIECVQCWRNEVNLDHKVSLRAQCKGCQERDVVYHWELLELFYQDKDLNYFDGDPMACVNSNGTLMMMVSEPDGNQTLTMLMPYNISRKTSATTARSETSDPVLKTTEAPVPLVDIAKEIVKEVREEPSIVGEGETRPKEGDYLPDISEADSRRPLRPDPIGFMTVEEGGATGTARNMGRVIDTPIEMPGGGRDLNDVKNKPLTTAPTPGLMCDDQNMDCRRPEATPSPPPPHLVSMRRIPSGLTDDQTLTGLDQPSLVIKPGVLRQGNTYLVKVKATGKDGSHSTAMSYFQVNQSPRKGKCTLKPHTGFSMNTVFSFYCNEWRDEHTPMRFEVSFRIKGTPKDDQPQIVYRGLRHNMNFQLPAGQPSHGYEVVVSITVLDRLLARTPICEDTIVVRPLGVRDLSPALGGRVAPGRRRGVNRGDGSGNGYNGRRNDRASIPSVEREVADIMLLEEADRTKQMARQSVYNGIVPDIVALLRQLTSRLNDDQYGNRFTSDDHQHRRSSPRVLARQTIVEALKLLPLRSQLELAQVLRCLSDVVSVTRELNEVTIANTVHLLRDVTSQADTQLKFDSQGMNFDIDPALLTLTVRTASSLLTTLAGSDTLFDLTGNREGFYRKVSSNVTTCVKDMIALRLQVQSVGEVPVHVTSPFMSIHAFQLHTGLHKPVTLEDVQFHLPKVSNSLLQQWLPSSNTEERAHSARRTDGSMNKEKVQYRSNRIDNEPSNDNINDNSGTDLTKDTHRDVETPYKDLQINNRNSGDYKQPEVENNHPVTDDTGMAQTSGHTGRAQNAPKRRTSWADVGRHHRFMRDDDCFQSRAISFHSDPNTLIPGKSGKVQTAVASLDLYSCDGSEHLNVKDLSDADLVRIDIHRQEANESSFGYPHYLKKTDMNVHELMPGGESGPLVGSTGYPAIEKLLYIHIQLEPIPPGQLAFPLLVLISHRSVPHNSHSFVYKKVFNTSEQDIKIILPVTSIKAGKSYSVGIAEGSFNSGRRRSSEVKGLHYNLSAWWDTCVYWDEGEQSWKNDGCQVLESSTLQILHCSCSHLTAFGGFFDFIPHHLTVFSLDEFFSPHESLLIVIVVGVILLTYLVMVLLIRPSVGNREDDQRRGRVVFLQDHCPSHRHKYEVIMETGFHPDSGTTSKISLILHGDEGVSETRELTVADNLTLFERNSRNRFIITLPESPGRISKIQMWHNNSGDSPGWFLRQAVVRDLSTGQTFYFLCQRWLAVDRDDGKVEREFSVLDGSAMTFSQVFVCKGAQYLSDLHTWLSVFTCPPNSHFTRSQRLLLCMATVMSYMGLSTVWFHLMPSAIRGEFGLLDLSWTNIVTGCVICCIMFPVVHALAFLFRRSCVSAESASKSPEASRGKSGLDLASQGDDDNNMAPAGSVPYSILDQSILNWQHIQEWAHRQWQKRQVHIMSSTDAIKDAQTGQQQTSPSMIPLVQQTMLAGEEDTELGSSGFEDATSQATAERNRIMATPDTSSLGKKSDSEHSSSASVLPHRRLLLPSWCRYIAWVVCVLLTGAGAAVTVWYGFRFSHRRSVWWIQTVYSSLIASIFVLQPVVILLKTVWVSLRHRHNPAVFDIDRDQDDGLDLDWEERKYHEMSSWHDEDEMQKGLAARSRSRYLRFAGPIQEKQLKSSRRKLLKEKKAITLFRLGCALVVLTMLLTVLTFGRNRSYQVQLHQAAHRMFAGSLGDKSSFVNVKSVSDWHRWSQQEFVTSLSSLETLTKGKQTNTSSELGLVVGDVQLRQFKVKPQNCASLRPADAMCFHDYSSGNGDESYDGFGMWQIGSPPGLWGYMAWYGRDGFVLPLDNSNRDELLYMLEILEYSQWLDTRTRAVSIEMTVYNPPSNLYSSITLLMEVSASGKVIPSVHIRSTQLFHYVTLWENVLLACELVFLVFIIVILSHTSQKLFHQRLAIFKQFWNCVEMAMSVASFLYTVLYIYRFVVVIETVEALRSTFYESFVSFAFLTLWDEMLHTTLGLMLFCVVLQWIRVCSYNPTIARLIGVYKKSRREMTLAAGLFAGQILAFSSLGHVLFGVAHQPMHSFMSTAMTVTALSARILCRTDSADSFGLYTMSIFFLFTFVFLHGLVCVYIFSVLCYKLKGSKIKKRLSMPPNKLIKFYWNYIWERTSPRKPQQHQESENTLSPEFIMAEILYLVDELLFRMNNLLGTSGLPEKQHSFSDSDSTPDVEDDGISTGGSDDLHNIQAQLVDERCDILDCNRLEDRVHRIEDKLCSNEPYLAQLLKLDSFGANILSEEEEQELRSQLEFEIFQQLQKQRQETSDVNYATCCPPTKLEYPKIAPPTLHRETNDTTTALAPKVPNNKTIAKQMNTPDTPHMKLHSPKRLGEIKSPEFFPDVEMKATTKTNPPVSVLNTKSLKRSQSLKVPVRDTAGIFDTSPQGFKKTRQGCIVETDVDSCNIQAKTMVNRHSSVKGKKEMLAFDRFGKRDTNTRPMSSTSILRKVASPRHGESTADSEKDQPLSLSHKSSSGNVSPQSSSEGERGHRRTDSSSGQSGPDTRLDTPKMLGKRLDLPPRPTFTHNASNLSPHKARPLDLVAGGELAAAESSSGSEQEAGLGGHKRMSSIGRRNLRKTKSRGKGKGDDVDINSAIVLSEDFHPSGRHGGFSDCSIIIHPVPANVDLDEISIPEEL